MCALCMCVRMYVYVCWGQRPMWESSPKTLHFMFWDGMSPRTQDILFWLSKLDRELWAFAGLHHPVLECRHVATPNFYRDAGIWTPVLTLACWELYGPSHLQAALIDLNQTKDRADLKASRGKGHIVKKRNGLFQKGSSSTRDRSHC